MKSGTSQISRWQECFKMFNAYFLVPKSAEIFLITITQYHDPLKQGQNAQIFKLELSVKLAKH